MLNEARRLLLRATDDEAGEPVGIRTEQNWVEDETGRATFIPKPQGGLPAALGV